MNGNTLLGKLQKYLYTMEMISSSNVSHTTKNR